VHKPRFGGEIVRWIYIREQKRKAGTETTGRIKLDRAYLWEEVAEKKARMEISVVG
jgi:hypothetical protein